MADGSVIFETEIDTGGVEKGLSGLGKNSGLLAKIDKVGFSLGSALGTALKGGLAAIGALGGGALALVTGSVNAMKELEQNLGGSEAVFEKYAKTVQQTGKKAYKSLGLSQSDYLATANKMGSLFKGLGYDTDEAAQLTMDAMQRAADVASVMGIDVAWAMESIAGAAKGNFTMMDNLGVAINDTTLANYALEKGITKSVDKMSTQEKVALAMQLFMERTAYATGRYAAENNTLAGSLTTLGAAWENFLAGTGEESVDDLVWAIGNAVDVLTAKLQELMPRLQEELPQMIEKLTPVLSQILETVLPSLTKMVVALVPPIAKALGEAAKLLAPALLDGLLTGAFGEEGAAKVMDTFKKIFGIDQPVTEAAAKAQEIWMQKNDPVAGAESAFQKIGEWFGIGSAGAEDLPPEVSESNQKMAESAAADLDAALLTAFQNGEISYDQLVALRFGSEGESAGAGGENPMSGVAAMMVDDLVAAFQMNTAQVVAGLSTLLNTAKTSANTGQFSSVGADIAGGIARGISNGTGVVVAAVRRLVKAALEAAENAAQIKSPSRLFRDEVGAMIAAGTAKGVDSNAHLLRKATTEMVLAGVPDISAARFTAARYAPQNTAGIIAGATTSGVFNQTNHFNVPVQTPDEFAATMRLYATYGLQG